MTEGSFPKVDGDILHASEVNKLRSPVQQVYTGTGFNVSSSNNTDTQSTELTAITAANIAGATYLKISILGVCQMLGTNDATNSTLAFQIQTKETGGSYGDSLASTIFYRYEQGVAGSDSLSIQLVDLVWYHILTAGEKANGIQVKLFASGVSGTTCTSVFTNKQTILQTI